MKKPPTSAAASHMKEEKKPTKQFKLLLGTLKTMAGSTSDGLY